MSTDHHQSTSDAPLANDYEAQAEKLREAIRLHEQVADANPVVEAFLRDMIEAQGDAANIIERDGDEITIGEFAERVYPTRGGRR